MRSDRRTNNELARIDSNRSSNGGCTVQVGKALLEAPHQPLRKFHAFIRNAWFLHRLSVEHNTVGVAG